MKRTIKILFTFLIFSFCFLNVKAEEKYNIYFFHGNGCPHCENTQKFLDSIIDDYPEFKIVQYEVWYNESNAHLLTQVQKKLNIGNSGIPLVLIGKNYFTGDGTNTMNQIEKAMKNIHKTKYVDVLDAIASNKDLDDIESSEEKETIYDLPLIGKVNVKNFSLPIISIVIGLVDGFNPCAMWVLLFLITMLINMKDRKKMWVLGLTFLLTSALMYLMIMLTWLNIIVNLTTIVWIRNIIAIIAIIGSIFNFRSFYKAKQSGCEVVKTDQRKSIISRIKKYTTEKSFWFAFIGIIGLAISVNLIELACSAGLPLIYTQILAVNNVTGITAFIYTLLYILFFLLDDLIIFIIAMTTLKVTGFSTKYSRWSHLIGGIIMLLIGVLLIVKPEWIMFNF